MPDRHCAQVEIDTDDGIYLTVEALCWLPCYLRYTHTISNKLASTAISNVCHNALSVLDLRGMGLSTLPQAIRNAVSLRHLNLSYNAFLSVPSVLYLLPALCTLDLEGNAIPFIFCDDLLPAKSLTCLKLAHNRLSNLPECIGNLIGMCASLLSWFLQAAASLGVTLNTPTWLACSTASTRATRQPYPSTA
jgi:hypothetical protein